MNLETLTLPLEVANKGFNAGIAAAIAGVTALVGAMGMAVKATFDWADQLDGIQDIMGATNEEAAALNFTLRKSGVATDTLTKGMTILDKGLVKADGTLDTTGKALKSWGINVKDVNGKLKGQTALVGDIAKKYNSFATQQEKVNFLTEVFGRSGAELIDFFDTLGAEGGIDKVTEKVKSMGLVIDPQRYENFTRSLEELKMVGLGLAVGFTEKIMPALEGFLKIITDPNLTFGQKIEALAQSASQFVSAWWSELQTAWDSINWDEFTAKLSAKIDTLDFSGAGSKLGDMIDSAFATQIDTHGWWGVVESLGRGIDAFFQSAVGADAFGGWKNYFFVWGEQIKAGFGATLQNWQILASNFINQSAQSAATWSSNLVSGWISAVNQWGTSVYNSIIAWLNKITAALNSIPGVPKSYSMDYLPSAGTSNSKTKTNAPRASGGPVIGGQTYYAHAQEIFTDGMFTAPSSGRIDPMKQGNQQGINIDEFAEKVGVVVAQQVQRWS